MNRLPLVVTALALFSAPATAAVVALDARSLSQEPAFNPALSIRYTMFRDVFAAGGHTVVNLSSFTTADLAGVDLLVLFLPSTPGLSCTAQEVTDVRAFLTGGRSLLLMGDSGWFSTTALATHNAILQGHGITFDTSDVNPDGASFAQFVPHEVTSGVTVMGLDFHRVLSVQAPATDLSNAPVDVVAASELVGGGRIVVTGDTSCFLNPGTGADFDISDLDNRRFLENARDWLLLPFGPGCPGSGGVVPKLTANTFFPPAGSQLGVQLTKGLGGAPATFFFGAGQASLPMAGTCTLNVAPLLPLSFTVPLSGTGAGSGSVFFAGILPAGSSGFTFAMQAFVTDPSVPHGFSNSNEIVIDIQ